MAEVVTPNIPEAEILSGMTITDTAGWRPLQNASAKNMAVPCSARAAIR